MLAFILFRGARRLMRRIGRAVSDWQRRHLELQALRSIDEHTLRDIGLSHRAAAERPLTGGRR